MLPEIEAIDGALVEPAADDHLGGIPVGRAAVAKVAEPKFALEVREGELEVRQYQARITAQTRVQGDRKQAESEGFRRLAGYIFGGNRTKTKIAMTAPVGKKADGEADGEDSWTVSFTMPEAETRAELLRSWLSARGLRATGGVEVNRYPSG